MASTVPRNPFHMRMPRLPRCRYGWSLMESRLRARCVSGAARLSSSSSRDSAESYDIRCGSSGSITVDIFNSHNLANPNRPLILYLPPSGVSFQSQHPVIPSFLLLHPLARINYRWNHLPSIKKGSSSPLSATAAFKDYPFPTPLHDTLHAYTWLTTQYLASSGKKSHDPPPLSSYPSPSPSRPPSPYGPQPPKTKTIPRWIILYGSHLGGPLATSLALTECRASRNVSFNIAGLIVTDGVFDWTRVATSRDPLLPSDQIKKQKTSQIELSQPWTTQTLHNLKQRLFTNPASCFDSFASPTLFFRTPGLSIPRYFPGTEPPSTPPTDLSALSLSDAEYAALSSSEHDSLPPPNQSTLPSPPTPSEANHPTQKSNLKYPPRDSDLKIPRSLFLTTDHQPRRKKPGKRNSEDDGGKELGSQADEMTRLMRRSIVKHEFKERAMWDEDLDPHQAAEERVQRVELRDGDEQARVIGEWLEGCD